MQQQCDTKSKPYMKEKLKIVAEAITISGFLVSTLSLMTIEAKSSSSFSFSPVFIRKPIFEVLAKLSLYSVQRVLFI